MTSLNRTAWEKWTRLNCNHYVLPFLAFVVALLLHVFLNGQVFMVSSGPDEIGTMSTAAYLAGYDWSGAFANQGFYYGFGSAWFLAPIFHISTNPFVIYYWLRFALAIIASIPTLLAWRLLTRYFHVGNKLFVFWGSIVCSVFTSNTSFSFTNEPMLILCVWILFYLIVALQHSLDDTRKKAWLSFFAALVLCYSLTVHTRAILYMVVFIIVILIYALYTKRLLINPYVFVSVCVVGFILARLAIAQVQTAIFSQGAAEVLHNSTGQLSERLGSDIPAIFECFGAKTSLKGLAALLSGNLLGLCVFSIGMAIVAVWIFLFRAVKISKKRFKYKQQKGFRRDILFPMSFCIIGGMIAMTGHCIMNIYQGAQLYAGGDIGDGRFFFYLRYYIDYLGPLFLVLMLTFFVQRKKLKTLLMCTSATIIAIWAVFQISVVGPMKQFTMQAMDVGTLFSSFLLRTNMEHPFQTTDYAVVVLIILLLLFTVFVTVRFRKPVLAICLIGLLMIYQQGFETIKYRLPLAQGNYYASDAAYRLFENNPELAEHVDQLYVYSNKVYRLHFPMQLMLYQKSIRPGFPPKGETESIVFSTDELTAYGYYKGRLDEDAYIYAKGDEYVEILRDDGVDMEYISIFSQPMTSKTEPYKLHHAENSVVDEESGDIIVSNWGIQFGPYVDLEKGHYIVEVNGENLLDAHFRIAVDNGEKSLPFTIQAKTAEKIVAEFELKKDWAGIEFINEYTGSDTIVIHSIGLRQGEEQASNE